jgi:hypothetical protein
MKKDTTLVMLSTVLLSVIFLTAACVNVNTHRNTIHNDSAAPVSSSANATPMTQQGNSDIDYFKYYNAVKLGMTKDEVENAIGLQPLDWSGTPDHEAFEYSSREYFGVSVYYTSDMKVYSKVAVFSVSGADLSGHTAKPVTQEQCAQIIDGMPHADVVSLLGGDGVECSVSATKEDCTTVTSRLLCWFNTDGSYIQVSFTQDDTALNATMVVY